MLLIIEVLLQGNSNEYHNMFLWKNNKNLYIFTIFGLKKKGATSSMSRAVKKKKEAKITLYNSLGKFSR